MITSVECTWCVWRQLFDSILLTLPRQTTSSTGKSPSQSVLELARDINEKTPDVFDIETVQFLVSATAVCAPLAYYHVQCDYISEARRSSHYSVVIVHGDYWQQTCAHDDLLQMLSFSALHELRESSVDIDISRKSTLDNHHPGQGSPMVNRMSDPQGHVTQGQG